MHQTIENIGKTRQYLLQVTEDLGPEALNRVPPGFSNNIIWNIGHLVAAQQGVCYIRSGHADRIDQAFYEAYKPGSRPAAPVAEPEILRIKDLLTTSLDRLQEDYSDGLLGSYQPFTTRYGAVLSTIDEALEFLLYHEGMHSGYIMALKRVVSF